MANLLNEKQKNNICQEYIWRFLAVLFFIISLLGIFILAYLIPYYLSVLNNNLIVSEQLKSVIVLENKENTGDSISLVVARTNEQIKAVDQLSHQEILPSAVFAKIIGIKGSSIKINRLNYKMIGLDQGQIFINGVAKDRQSLVLFISNLKNKVGFSNVESPVSDFAKDFNIPFTINIKTSI